MFSAIFWVAASTAACAFASAVPITAWSSRFSRSFSLRRAVSSARLSTSFAAAVAAAFASRSSFAMPAADDLSLSVLYAPRLYGLPVRGLMPADLRSAADGAYRPNMHWVRTMLA